jgi:hypothetical protein
MHPKLPFSPNFHKQHHHQLLQQGCAPPLFVLACRMWMAGTRVADTRVVDTLLATPQGVTLTLSQTAPPGGCSDSPLTGGSAW